MASIYNLFFLSYVAFSIPFTFTRAVIANIPLPRQLHAAYTMRCVANDRSTILQIFPQRNNSISQRMLSGDCIADKSCLNGAAFFSLSFSRLQYLSQVHQYLCDIVVTVRTIHHLQLTVETLYLSHVLLA
ncbi:hypothetical protein F4678DRAFT_422386 [Xylaria arbuscula]|nr:hypothetical protein F4678DRAFT_422386 [Xylaria arbuscula]